MFFWKEHTCPEVSLSLAASFFFFKFGHGSLTTWDTSSCISSISRTSGTIWKCFFPWKRIPPYLLRGWGVDKKWLAFQYLGFWRCHFVIKRCAFGSKASSEGASIKPRSISTQVKSGQKPDGPTPYLVSWVISPIYWRYATYLHKGETSIYIQYQQDIPIHIPVY